MLTLKPALKLALVGAVIVVALFLGSYAYLQLSLSQGTRAPGHDSSTSLAEISTSLQNAPAPLNVSFRAVDLAHGMFGDPLSYRWDFGDGSTSTLQNPTHTYAKPGSYTVTLSITYSDRTVQKATTVITVTEGQKPAAQVGDLTLEAEPSFITVQQFHSGPDVRIVITSKGFAGDILLSLGPVPGELSARVVNPQLSLSPVGQTETVLRVSDPDGLTSGADTRSS